MPVLSGATNVNENGVATGDVTDGSTTVTRLLYNDRAAVPTEVAIAPGPGGTTVLTQYGTLTIHQDGTYTYTPDESLAAVNGLDTGETLTDPFSYDFGLGASVSVGDASDNGTTTVTINGVDDAPTIVNTTYTIGEDSGPFFQAAPGYLGDNTDPEGDTLTAPTLIDGPDNGTWTALVDGSFTYTPDANFFGTDTVTVSVSDGTNTVTEVITFIVNADATTADPYVANDDGSDPGAAGTTDGFTPFLTQAEDTVHTYTIGTVGGAVGDGNFLANDENPDGEAIVVQSISNLFDAATGLLVGTITYDFTAQTYTIDPNDNYNGAAYFDYVAATTQNTADPTDDQVDQGRVFVTITSVNDAPVLGDGTGPGTTDGDAVGAGTEDAPIVTAVPAASDAHGGAPGENNVPLTYSLVGGSAVLNGGNGTFSINPATGAVTYTPGVTGADQALDTGESRVVSVDYVVTDSLGATSVDAGTVTVTVNGVNDAPVANNDSFAATEDTTLPADASRNVLANDTDVDVEPLTAVPATGFTSAGGTYQLFSNGTFTYTPAADYDGVDTFTYQANDGTVNSAPATVSITVGNTADNPVAADDGPYNVTEDVPGQAAGLQFGGAAFRTNANGFFDERQLVDGTGLTGTGNADSDPDAGAPGNLDITSVGAAVGGTVQLYTSPGGVQYVVFTPTPNYSGPASFDYAVTDPQGNSDIGRVTLVVQEATDGGPVATDDALTGVEQTTQTITAAQLLGNDADADNNGAGLGTDRLVIRAIQNIQNATISNIVLDANGNIVSFDITSNSDVNGADASFDYVVDDTAARTGVAGDTAAPGGIGGIRTPGAPDTRSGTDIGTVTIDITNVNDDPDANDDVLPGTSEDSTTGVTFTAAQLLANDTDADNNGNTNAGLTATIPTGAVNGGTITNNGNGTYTFIPSANFNGTATFTYTVTDTAGATDSATVFIPVASVNDAPVAGDDTLTRTVTNGAPLIAEDRPSTFSWAQLLGNDTDVDGDTLTITSGTSPFGTVTVDPVGETVTFTPTTGYLGPAYFDYTVDDGNGGSDVGRASFTVVDQIQGGSTGETLGGGSSSIVVNGGGGNDTLNGTPETDELYGEDGNDTLNGFGSADFLRGGLGNDTANGGDGNDTIYMDDGGTDTANGDAGNDGIFFGAAMTGADTANGGAGSDTLALRGNYGTGIGGNSYFFSATNLIGIETLLLVSGTNTTTFPAPGGTTPGSFDYYFTSQDANLAAGQTLTVVSGSPQPGVNGLQAGEDLYFDGTDEKDGQFRFFLGEGNDRLFGGQLNDGFFFATGAFTGADQVNGRGGMDTLALRGDYSGGVTLTNVVNTEIVSLLSGTTNEFGGPIVPGGYDYDITLATANVTTGQTLQINGANLKATETLTVNGNAIFGGNLTIFGGAGADDLSGGLQSNASFGPPGTGGVDLLYGGLGGDTMDGGRSGNGPFGGDDGSNVYLYRAAAESNGSQAGLDHIQGFNYQLDKIDINAGGPATNGFTGGIAGLAVSDVNAVFNGVFTDSTSGPLNNGVLDDSEFFTQLAAQLDTALNPGQAAFLQVTGDFSGQYNGSTIFVADTNGNGSVDSSDLIIVFDNLQGQLPPSTEFII